MTTPRRVAITGVGVIAPIGVGKDAFWDGLAAGRSGVRTITRFDASAFPTQIAAEVDGFDPTQFMPAKLSRRMDKTSLFGLCAAKMAVADASLDFSTHVDRSRAAVMYGTNLGHFDYDFVVAQWEPDGPSWKGATIESGLNLFPEACAGHISTEFALTGPSLIFASACSASLDAIGHGFRAIRDGELDAVIAGGSQAPISPPSVGAFCMVKGMSTRNDAPGAASRPFDKDRDGFVMGEGGAIIVMESLESAEARGARVYAEVLGYAATCDAYHITNPRPDGAEAARAVSLAIHHAGIDPSEIDYVNAHGTSTPLNDKTETLILRTVLGDHARRVPVSATKSMIGHLLGGAGAAELIAALLAIEHQTIPPTINYTTPDPECDLDYVPNVARPARVRTVLKNSFGFGGKNSALVVRAL